MMTAPVRIFANLAVDAVMCCLQPSLNIPLSGGLVEVSNRLTRRFFVARLLFAGAVNPTLFRPANRLPTCNQTFTFHTLRKVPRHRHENP
jgi:hypothetical protein